MAFGTGLHPTTRLCLAAIERMADEGLLAGSRGLDIGCGSGILAIAAARLGAASVLGLDTDPIAVDATSANNAARQIAGMTKLLETRELLDNQFDTIRLLRGCPVKL